MSVRPSLTPTTTIDVRYGIALQQIIDMDERNQILTTNVWLRQYWEDVHLQWDPDDYDGISTVNLPASSVWKPDVILYNTADDAMKGITETDVEIQYNGNVSWYAPAVFKSSCKINILYFPVDEQHCLMQFGSWSYAKSSMRLTNSSSAGDISSFIDNGEWELRGMPVQLIEKKYTCCDDLFPVLEFTVIIGRRSFFYIFNLILPCIVVTAMTILTFYLPAHAYEKLTLCITILLSLAVFLLMVAETMPPTSEVVPILSQYFLVTMIIVFLSILVSVIVLCIHHCGTHRGRVPEWLRRLAFEKLEPILCLTRCSKGESLDTNNQTPFRNYLGDRHNGGTHSMKLYERKLTNQTTSRKYKLYGLLETVGDLTKNIVDAYDKQDVERQIESEWIRVGYVLDRIALWAFSLITIIYSCLFFGKMYVMSYSSGNNE
ncbi:neuronal acetylcholine receptor subunit alpha-10-like [Antedon mediterranea]|uniref:neuronal acetylcholine receptor subunit alpha-10-like n=1 Tax=Antedon mediterranea TaxID=105859 RepID=UPI003AF76BA9